MDRVEGIIAAPPIPIRARIAMEVARCSGIMPHPAKKIPKTSKPRLQDFLPSEPVPDGTNG